jgi:F-type H+-transporting ATPase subunit gamma
LKKTKQRIVASKNIQKITTAMKNVASAKMKSAELEAKASSHFVVGLNAYFNSLPKEGLEKKDGAHIMLPVTSDRGLCGAVNSTLVRLVLADLKVKSASSTGEPRKLIVLGVKGKDQLSRLHSKRIQLVFDEIQKKNVTFAQACAMTDEILAQPFDTLSIYHTKFINTATQIPSVMDLYSPKKVEELTSGLDEYECEPEKEEIMEAMYTFYFASNLYYCICTSLASEQASRMIAMDGASRNAKDMIKKLTLLFNRTRQAIITGQLIEITSAAESLK